MEILTTGICSFRSPACSSSNGTVGVIDINWMSPTKIRELSVLGVLGMFVVNYLTQDLTLYENSSSGGGAEVLAVMGVVEGRAIRFPIQRVEPLRAEIESFVAAVRSGGKPHVDGDEGVRALHLAHLVARSGREQTVMDARSREELRA